MPPAVEVRSLNYWTTSEVPVFFFKHLFSSDYKYSLEKLLKNIKTAKNVVCNLITQKQLQLMF